MSDLRAFLGLDRPLRWERPLLLFAGLFAYDAVSITATRWQRGQWEFWPDMIFGSLWSNALLLALLCLALRLIRPAWMAAVAAAVAYGLSRSAIDWLPQEGLGGAFTDPLFWLGAGTDWAWTMAFLFVLAAALERASGVWLPTLLAALAGAATALLARFLLSTFGGPLPVAGAELLQRAPISVLNAVSLATVVWGGWRLAYGSATALSAPEQHMDRGYYLGLLYALFGIPCVISVAIAAMEQLGFGYQIGDSVPLPLLVAIALLVVSGAVVLLMFVHRMWAAIQGSGARTTPGRAVGLLFVPIFNFYWMFQVFPGFARDANRIAARAGLAVRPLPVGLFAAYPILSLLAAIPTLGVFLEPLSLAVALAIVARTCDWVNATEGLRGRF